LLPNWAAPILAQVRRVRLQTKILSYFGTLVTIALVGAFWLVDLHMNNRVRALAREQLETSRRVFEEILTTRAEGLVNALKPELNKTFKPAFLGRLVIIPYFPIRDEALKKIIVLKLAKIQRRLQETHKIAITYDDGLIDEVAKRCTEVESGARNVDNILTNTLLPEISKQILGRIAEGEKPQSIHVGIGEDGSFLYS
jgi:ATP-dependent Clp protease ATP-binding subunit ClpA